MPRRQSQQVNVGQRACTVGAVRHEDARVTQRYVIRPELVIGLRRKLLQPGNQIAWREARAPAVTRIGHNSDYPVFGERATGPAFLCIRCPPGMRPFVKRMIGVEQPDQDIDVEQSAQSLKPLLVHQLAHALQRDDLAARGQ